jgi:hypothetical protein
MSTEIDEDDVIGPTIWEAAAEEEIQENFWCVGPPRAILICHKPRNAQSAPLGLPTRIPRASHDLIPRPPHPPPAQGVSLPQEPQRGQG